MPAMTREETLQGLVTAHDLLSQMRAAVAEEDRQKGRIRCLKPEPEKPKPPFMYWQLAAFYALYLMGIAITLQNSYGRVVRLRSYWEPDNIWNDPEPSFAPFVGDVVIGIVMAVLMLLFLRFLTAAIFRAKAVVHDVDTESVAEENARIKTVNAEANGCLKRIEANKEAIREQWASDCASWYPPDYVNVAAAEAFLGYVRNYQAESIGEAVRLYDTECHRRRMELSQAQILAEQEAIRKEQKVNQLLTVVNIGVSAYAGAKASQALDAAERAAKAAENPKVIKETQYCTEVKEYHYNHY
ncbi:hypothetical protein QJ043_07145 [Olsenella sp. YH-ols2217]|uniref:Uncharacterized protein n=1 Tax=Kribbibacterium absianum TaxID=3044210 RepID=A0ABT6ZLD7_9ACTN|nr:MULTISPECIES: hypothetical protein [unclassified Olsenella]MDJ1121842.1 hypothetical protein [Olsenella sp. YH-ols2216]MDJ1129850.1 hypothetical protein [Olsenella sp. YH-ols2217]